MGHSLSQSHLRQFRPKLITLHVMKIWLSSLRQPHIGTVPYLFPVPSLPFPTLVACHGHRKKRKSLLLCHFSLSGRASKALLLDIPLFIAFPNLLLKQYELCARSELEHHSSDNAGVPGVLYCHASPSTVRQPPLISRQQIFSLDLGDPQRIIVIYCIEV